MQPVSCRGTAEEVKAMIKTDRRDDLPYPYRFPIDSLLLHRLQGQLSARLPGIGPPGVAGDVADGVADHGIGDPIDHASGQLVLPVGVPKLILFRMDGRARVSSVDTTIGSRIIILIATQVYAPPKLNKLFLSLLSLFCIPF